MGDRSEASQKAYTDSIKEFKVQMGSNSVKKVLYSCIRGVSRKFGFEIIRYKEPNTGDPYLVLPLDFDAFSIHIINLVERYTMTSPERVHALVEATKYVAKNNIEGAMVECGVWRGGSAMTMALTLLKLGEMEREIYLYDTFSGMSVPSTFDISITGERAEEKFSRMRISDDASNWCSCPLEEVKKNLHSTGYPLKKLHFVKGKVENTIPQNAPEKIALLRLDTDWYESIRHELFYLFPRLVRGGVLIIDDYGQWQGTKRAVDDYLSENRVCILLNRIDYTGRIAVKYHCGEAR